MGESSSPPLHTEDEFKRAHAGGRTLVGLAASMTVNLFLGPAPPNKEYHTACGIVIKHKSKLALITAQHVVGTRTGEYEPDDKSWENWLETDPRVRLQIGTKMSLAYPVVSYRDRVNDVVVLPLTGYGEQYFDHPAYDPVWPTPTPVRDDLVTFCGYPKNFRRDEEGGALFADFSASVPVTTVAEGRFVCQFQRENWQHIGYGPIPPQSTVLGGMSGTPVFMYGDLHYPLVGVITDHNEDLDLLYVASLNSLPPLDELV